MDHLSCYDSAGSPLSAVYQWDGNREIRLGGFVVGENKTYQVHFGSQKHDTAVNFEPDAIVGDPHGALLKTKIPLQFLEEHDTIDVYLYEIDDDTGESLTLLDAKISVVPRQMPGNYASVNTIKNEPVPDGLTLIDGVLYLTMDGEIIGTGINLNEMG